MAGRSVRSLPTAGDRVAVPPSKSPILIEEFAQVWLKNLLDSGYATFDVAIPDAGPFRASWASKRCDRNLEYAMMGAEESNPPSVADYWRMWTGTQIHQSVNETLRTIGNGWVADIDVDLRPIGIPGSAHADIVRFVDRDGEPWEYVGETWLDERNVQGHHYVAGDNEVVIADGEYDEVLMFPTHVGEIKSVSGYSWKMMATTQGGPPEGPRYGAIMQGAYVAAALGVEDLIVINLSLENVSPKLAAAYSTSEVGRFAGEWSFKMADLRPSVDADVARINRVQRAIEAEVLVAREMHEPGLPTGATILNPATGHWAVMIQDDVVQTGSHFSCAYCDYRNRCIDDGAGTETAVTL